MISTIKRFPLILILVLCISFLASGCKTDPLIGSWEEPTSGVTMEFGKNGDLEMGLHGVSIKMTYELEDPNIMIFKAGTEGTIPDQKMTYRLEEDKLVLTVDGIDTVLFRSK